MSKNADRILSDLIKKYEIPFFVDDFIYVFDFDSGHAEVHLESAASLRLISIIVKMGKATNKAEFDKMLNSCLFYFELTRPDNSGKYLEEISRKQELSAENLKVVMIEKENKPFIYLSETSGVTTMTKEMDSATKKRLKAVQNEINKDSKAIAKCLYKLFPEILNDLSELADK